MTKHSEKRLVPFSADLMFQVVADVEKYPEFLPWVVALRLKSRERTGVQEILIAEMAVGFGALRQRYTSRVTLDPVARTVEVVEIEGPFRQLENQWRITPNENGCEVDFRIAFEFANPLLQAIAGNAYEKVVMKMTDAFEARAKKISEAPSQ